jgi:acetyl esterase
MFFIRGTSFLALLVVSMSTVFGAATGQVLRNVEYSRVAGAPLYLDAAIPERPGPHPAAIIVHGGGWVRGDRRSDVAPLFAPLEEAGIAWFSIDYRLSDDITHFGAAIEDVQEAIRFVKSHAPEYRIDPERIALIGESAGGQLAAMAALKPETGNRVKTVVALYTPTDLVQLAKNSNFVPKQIRDSIHGTPFEGLILARLRQLSPVDNVNPGAPSFLLIHGTADSLVPYSQSVAMCNRLKQAGASCELYSVQGGGHGIRWWESSHPREAAAYKQEIVRWLRSQLTASGKASPRS